MHLVALRLLVELEHEEVDGEEAGDEEEGVHAVLLLLHVCCLFKGCACACALVGFGFGFGLVLFWLFRVCGCCLRGVRVCNPSKLL